MRRLRPPRKSVTALKRRHNHGCGKAARGLARRGTARHGSAPYGTARYGVAWCCSARYGMARLGVAGYGRSSQGMVRQFMTDLRELSLLDLVPALHPDWKSPYHLRPWCELIEASLHGNLRAMCAVPFQHYKSSTTLIGIVWLFLRNPKLRIILLTHSHEKAKAMGKDLRQLWKGSGGQTEKGFDTIDDWRLPEGGGCVVMSAGQSKLGYPCDLLLVDDPLDETEYMNREVRDDADKAISLYTARSASHLNSVLLVASRWHIDDPYGRRKRREGWKEFTFPGIIDYGTPEAKAFAPDVLTLAQHLEMRREWAEQDPSCKAWWAQVQNDPRPDELSGFRGPMRGPPPEFGRYVIGLDLAYSDKAYADYFALVVLQVWQGVAYVRNVLRERRDLETAARRILDARREYPGASVYTYWSGPEKGAIAYLTDRQIPVEGLKARTPKHNRAQHTRDAWNAGQIIVPLHASWAEGFISRAQLFTGREDAGDDDEIDALVSAYDGGVLAAGFVPSAFGRPRIARY